MDIFRLNSIIIFLETGQFFNTMDYEILGTKFLLFFVWVCLNILWGWFEHFVGLVHYDIWQGPEYTFAPEHPQITVSKDMIKIEKVT